MKVALVHDWLVAMRGAERVLEELCGIFPEAEIFTLFCDRSAVSSKISSHKIHTSFLQKFPLWRKYYRHLFPLTPLAIEKFDFRGFDLVVSVSWCAAHGVVVPSGVRHIAYVCTPMRYGWDMYHEYFGSKSRTPSWQRPFISRIVSNMRLWDQTAAQRPDEILACSKYVARKIKKYWGRESRVVYPPVESPPAWVKRKPEEYFLMVTTFEPSKNVELAVRVFNELGLPLKIAGNTGRHAKTCRRLASSNIEFLGYVSDELKWKLYGGARAFVFPGIDDFGITPVEAMAVGCPVIAYGKGGVVESVTEYDKAKGGGAGVFFRQATVADMVGAVRRFLKVEGEVSFDRGGVARRFSKAGFRESISGY